MFLSRYLNFFYMHLRDWMIFIYTNFTDWIRYCYDTISLWLLKLVTYFYITCSEWTAYYFSHTLDLLIATSLQLNWWIWSLMYILILFLILFLITLCLLRLRSKTRNCWQSSISQVMQVISNTFKQAVSMIWWLLNGTLSLITLYTQKTWRTLIQTGSVIRQSCHGRWHSMKSTSYTQSIVAASLKLWSTSKQVAISVGSFFMRILVTIKFWERTNPRGK